MRNFGRSLVLGALLIGSSMSAQARDLVVVSWGGNFQDVQRKIFFEPFSKQIGKPVIDETWDGGYGVLQAKVKAGIPNWDVVAVEAEELALGCADGIYEKLDWEKMGGRDAYLPDAVSDCGVGTHVWSTGLTYNGDILKTAPTSWADFWDTEKFPGKRGFRKGPKYALEFALMADGVKPADVYTVLRTPEGVDRAFKKLDELKPNIVWWEAAAQPLQLLASGEIVMSPSYNGRVGALNRTEGRHFGFVFPGSIYAIDSWVILKGSPNKEEASDFIAFASSPENQSKFPQFMPWGLTNIAAQKLVPEQYLSELPTAAENMKDAIPLDGEFWTDNLEELTQRFNAWVAQ